MQDLCPLCLQPFTFRRPAVDVPGGRGLRTCVACAPAGRLVPADVQRIGGVALALDRARARLAARYER